MIVRPVSMSDLEEWRELWRHYLDFYETKLPEQVYQTLWRRLHTDDLYEPRGLVAELDGHLVGLAHYVLQRHVWREEHVTYLSDLFVSPSLRGKQLGERLLEAVYSDADHIGAPYVYWSTDHDNTVARKLYDRCGHLSKSILYRRFEGRT